MQKHSLIVWADWDEAAKLWSATTADFPDFSVQAGSFEGLTTLVYAALATLVARDGLEAEGSELPVHILIDRVLQIPTPNAA